MKAIFIGKGYKEIDVPSSKRAYCQALGCELCKKEEISIEGHWFGIVHDYEWKEDARVSGVNVFNNPELLGDFIILGLKGNKLVGLTEKEAALIKQHLSCIGGRAILYGIE